MFRPSRSLVRSLARIALVSLVTGVALSSAACVASTEPAPESTAAQGDPIKNGGVGDLGDDPSSTSPTLPARLPFPPPAPHYCAPAPGDPHCKVRPLPLPSQWDAELALLGCSAPFAIDVAAILYVGPHTAALCPDNATTRKVAAAHGFSQVLSDEICSECMPKVPAGQAYLLLDAPYGSFFPGCPSGCGLTH